MMKLYNLFFPVWLAVWFPFILTILIPLNFVWDYIVCRLSRKLPKDFIPRTLWKVVLFGFLADLIGTGLMFVGGASLQGEIGSAIMMNPFLHPVSLFYVTLCVVVTAFLVYFFNLYFALKEMENPKRTALFLAILTAPYLFYFPSMLLWK